MTPDEYCLDRTGGRGSSLYYSLLFAAPELRRGANAVHAFVAEARGVVVECNDPAVAHSKFGWWREELLRLYAGTPRHPVTQALAPAITSHRLEIDAFMTVIDEMAHSVGTARFPDFASLHRHCLRSGSTPAWLAARATGVDDPTVRPSVDMFGLALRLTDILCSMGEDVRRERLYLPLEDLQRFGVAESDVLACRHSAAFESLMAFETERALHHFDLALARISARHRFTLLPSRILANIARARLDELRRDGYRVLERRLALTPLRKLWIAWKTRLSRGGGGFRTPRRS